MRTRPRHRRWSWGPLLMLLVSVVASGVLLRIDPQAEDGTLSYPTEIGQLGTMNNQQRARVDSYEVTSALTDSQGRPTAISSDLILVVHLTLESSTATQGSVDVQVRSGERRIGPLESLYAVPHPGFRVTASACFEISADDLAGAVVELWMSRTMSYLDRKVVVDLAITEQRARELAEQGRFRSLRLQPARQEPQ